MRVGSSHSVTRRTAVKAGVGGLAFASAAALARPAAATPHLQRAIQSGGGAAGGGIVATGSGDAQFLFFGTRMTVADQDEPVIFGQFQWLSTDGTLIESVEVENYGPIEGDPVEDREMSGVARMNGEGRFAFTVRIVDGGKLGEGNDTLTLTVGPEEGATPAATPEPVISAEGLIIAGGVQLVELA